MSRKNRNRSSAAAELAELQPPMLQRLQPEADKGEAIEGVFLVRRGSSTQAIRCAMPAVLVEQYATQFARPDSHQVTAGEVDRMFDDIYKALLRGRREL